MFFIIDCCYPLSLAFPCLAKHCVQASGGNWVYGKIAQSNSFIPSLEPVLHCEVNGAIIVPYLKHSIQVAAISNLSDSVE